jgi:hypothetical protein
MAVLHGHKRSELRTVSVGRPGQAGIEVTGPQGGNRGTLVVDEAELRRWAAEILGLRPGDLPVPVTPRGGV